jgi:hypothetical protein
MGGGRKSKGGAAPPATPAKKMCLGPAALPAASSSVATPGGSSTTGCPSFGLHHTRALAILSPTAHPSHFLVNTDHWAEVEAAWQLIVDHPQFSGIMSEMPLPIGETGIIAFNAVDFRTSMSNGKPYTCGANAFWASPFFTTSPGVPINRHDVHALAF